MRLLLSFCSCSGLVGELIVPVDSNLFPKVFLEPNVRFLGLTLRNAAVKQPLLYPGLSFSIFSRARVALKRTVDLQWNLGDRGPLRASTLSGSGYLSSCVTDVLPEILIGEPSLDSRNIYVSDFGYGSPDSSPDGTFKIWDDAWSLDFSSADRFFKTGGEYYISSLPKIFGFPLGGLLVYPEGQDAPESDLPPEIFTSLVDNFLKEVERIPQINSLRRTNISLVKQFLPDWTVPLENDIRDGKIPGVLIMKPPVRFDEVLFKALINSHGVRTTAFFGNQAVLVPIHQDLNEESLKITCDLIAHCVTLASSP
jgi:hypothetical protein